MSAQKRRAEDDLRSEQRLAKRFDLLNLEHNGKLYLPVQQPHSRPPSRPSNDQNDSMQVDDTKDRIYIHNLDDELSDIEAEEERLVFLPDIEKKLGKIPKSVLLGEGHPSIGTEVVLYSVPSSLTVPEEQDKVRKAIIESRARAREKQLYEAEATQVNGDASEGEKLNGVANHGHVSENHITGIGEDEDAMEIE